MTTESEKQVHMHKDLFDRSKNAIENGCYFESILLEYAAIEGRLEVILGILGLPCNKDLNPEQRSSVMISHRIQCLNYICKNNINFKTTKLDNNFFSNNGVLKKWIKERNTFIHGLYKSSEKYTQRIKDAEKLAADGYEITRLLYNEAKRLRRLSKNHPEQFQNCNGMCRKSNCKVNPLIIINNTETDNNT